MNPTGPAGIESKEVSKQTTSNETAANQPETPPQVSAAPVPSKPPQLSKRHELMLAAAATHQQILATLTTPPKNLPSASTSTNNRLVAEKCDPNIFDTNEPAKLAMLKYETGFKNLVEGKPGEILTQAVANAMIFMAKVVEVK